MDVLEPQEIALLRGDAFSGRKAPITAAAIETVMGVALRHGC
jgi:hypothetical protein